MPLVTHSQSSCLARAVDNSLLPSPQSYLTPPSARTVLHIGRQDEPKTSSNPILPRHMRTRTSLRQADATNPMIGHNHLHALTAGTSAVLLGHRQSNRYR